MSEHTITWDHKFCEHAEEECNPEGTLTCQVPAGQPGKNCCCLQEHNPRGKFDYCEGWSICDYPEREHAMCPDFEHHNPGDPHCTEGHRLVLGPCNAVEWIHCSGTIEESAQDGYVSEYKDSEVEIEWTGEGYLWYYSDPVAVA